MTIIAGVDNALIQGVAPPPPDFAIANALEAVREAARERDMDNGGGAAGRKK